MNKTLVRTVVGIITVALALTGAGAVEAAPKKPAKAPAWKAIAGKPPRPDVTPAQGVAKLLAGPYTASKRSGLGLPSYAKLLGRSWAKKVKAADARFVTRLGKAGAKASAKEPDALMRATDALKGPGGKQTRKLRIAVGLESSCPVPDEEPYDGFWMNGKVRGDYEVTTVERVGHYDVTTAVVMDVQFEAHSGSSVFGKLSGVGSSYGHITVTRNQTARDRRTGKVRSTGPTQRLTESLSPLLILDGGFDDFVNAQDDDEAPAPRRVLRTAQWNDLAQKFVAVVYMSIERDFAAAGKKMEIPNACMQVKFDTPERLAPGQSTPLIGQLSVTQGKPTPRQLYNRTHIRSYAWVNFKGQKLFQFKPQLGDWKLGEKWFDFEAPPATWPENAPIGVKFIVEGYAGVAEATVMFKPLETQLYFKVINASLENKTSAEGQDTYCGTQAGTKSFTGSFADAGFSAEDTLKLERGRWSGEVEGRVNARWHSHRLIGCESGPQGKQRCEQTMPDRVPGGDGTAPVSVSFSSEENSDQVTLRWGFDQPEVGFVDAGDPECNVHIWGAFDQEISKQTIPLAKLQSTAPITLTLGGTGTLDKNRNGMLPAQITHTWNYSLTIQRVDAGGNPLG